MRGSTIVVCVLVLTAGCLGSGGIPAGDRGDSTVTNTESTPQQPTTPSSARYDVDIERIEDLIHERMNERRVENGVDPLERNETLDAVARYKSWDMAQRDYFAHTGPNGSTHSELRKRYELECSETGQNIYKKEYLNEPYPQSELSDSEQIASDAVDSLFESPGHRQNALSSNYDAQGIGVFVDENGTVFVPQELCG